MPNVITNYCLRAKNTFKPGYQLEQLVRIKEAQLYLTNVHFQKLYENFFQAHEDAQRWFSGKPFKGKPQVAAAVEQARTELVNFKNLSGGSQQKSESGSFISGLRHNFRAREIQLQGSYVKATARKNAVIVGMADVVCFTLGRLGSAGIAISLLLAASVGVYNYYHSMGLKRSMAIGVGVMTCCPLGRLSKLWFYAVTAFTSAYSYHYIGHLDFSKITPSQVKQTGNIREIDKIITFTGTEVDQLAARALSNEDKLNEYTMIYNKSHDVKQINVKSFSEAVTVAIEYRCMEKVTKPSNSGPLR